MRKHMLIHDDGYIILIDLMTVKHGGTKSGAAARPLQATTCNNQ